MEAEEEGFDLDREAFDCRAFLAGDEVEVEVEVAPRLRGVEAFDD